MDLLHAFGESAFSALIAVFHARRAVWAYGGASWANQADPLRPAL